MVYRVEKIISENVVKDNEEWLRLKGRKNAE